MGAKPPRYSLLNMLGTTRGFSGLSAALRNVLLGTGISLLLVTSCGQAEERDPPGDGIGPLGGNAPTGGLGGTGARGGSNATGGMGAEGGEGDALAPTVRITSPEHLEVPDDGTVLVETTVTVTCEVAQSSARGSEPVDRSTVTIELISADGDVLHLQPGAETETRGEFAAEFVLTDVPNGPCSFRCAASDTATPEPHSASETITTFVDHGPTIEVTSPLEDSAYSLLGAVPFVFTVTPDPLIDDDEGAELDSVSLRVLGRDIELDEQSPGEFRATVDFADPTQFPIPPETVSVLIVARNVRAPEAGERSLDYFFALDSMGPAITVTAPLAEDDRPPIVGGDEVRLEFNIQDDLSEVDPRTVAVTINQGDPVYFDETGPWTRDGNRFVYRFDATKLEGSVAQATINIDAKDMAGNPSPGQAIVVYIDNQPPIVDLDPPYVREINISLDPDVCSVAFDPVGDAAANDLAAIERAQLFRALVWSHTNVAPGQTVTFHSPTREDSVYLYIRDRPSATRPLLVDTDGDDICDDVASTGLPDVVLSPLTQAGSPWFGGATDEPGYASNDLRPDPPPMTGCVYATSPGQRPERLCLDTSDMFRVIKHSMDGRPSVIYALNNSDGVGADCSGVDWEIGFAAEGWVCVAGVAEDLVGNRGVSRPLRLCYDDGVGAPADCSGPPPSCTDGCTLRSTPSTGPYNSSYTFKP